MSDKFANGTGYKEQPILDDYIGPYEARIYALEQFIKKARDETYPDNHFGTLIHVVPEWFMTDDIVDQ